MTNGIHFLQSRNIVKKYFLNIDDFEGSKFYPDEPSANDILVTFSPYEKQSMRYALKWLSKGGKVIAVLDGVFDFSNAFEHPFYTSSYKLFYPALCNVIIAGSVEHANLIRGLNPNLKVTSYQFPSLRNDLDCRNISDMKEFDFLITTANSAYFNDMEREQLIRFIVEAIEYLDQNGFSYCLRLFDKSLLSTLGEAAIGKNLCEDTFSNVAKRCRNILTTPSTVVVEAIAMDIPVGVFLYRNFPLTIQGGWVVRSVDSIQEVIEDMVVAPPERMDIQRALLANFKETDFPEVTPSILKSLAINSPSIKDVSMHYAFDMLESKWNFNLKYFIKKWAYRLFQW